MGYLDLYASKTELLLVKVGASDMGPNKPEFYVHMRYQNAGFRAEI